MFWKVRWGLLASVVGVLVASVSGDGGGWTATTVTIRPRADGTLADGNGFGPFDGVADVWDWYFNGSTFEGAITLTMESPQSALEHRVVWEYDLSTVSITPPLTATLTVTLRGSTIWSNPSPDAYVNIYSYPADLLETPDDFASGPAELQGSVVIVPLTAPAVYSFDVSGAVNRALSSGTDKVAFRFQIDPNTPHPSSQAFIDAVDTDVTTKPFLTLEDVAPGDATGDGVVDLDDFEVLTTCMVGPGSVADLDCQVFDFDHDSDVDAADFRSFLAYYSDP